MRVAKHSILALFALLLCLALPAHADYTCPTPTDGGRYWSVYSDGVGYSAQWVCATPDGDRVQNVTWLKDEILTPICAAALPFSVMATLPDKTGQLNTWMSVCSTTQMVDGHFDEPRHDAVYQAALARTRVAYAADHPASAPSGPVWRAPAGGSSLYPVTATGKLGVPIASQRAPGLALLDCVLQKIVQGGFTYCPPAGAAPGTVATAVLQP